jgi:hypothetical protein
MKTSTLQQRFNPLNDYLFYKVMGEKGSETQLLGFLNAVLGRTGEDEEPRGKPRGIFVGKEIYYTGVCSYQITKL